MDKPTYDLGYIADADPKSRSYDLWVRGHYGLQIADPTRLIRCEVTNGVKYSTIAARNTWYCRRKAQQRKTMRFLPTMVQALLLLWLVPGFTWVGYKFHAGHFIVMGWIFSIVFSMVARMWLKDKYL